MFLSLCEVHFFYALADDLTCSTPRIGDPKPAWKDPAISYVPCIRIGDTAILRISDLTMRQSFPTLHSCPCGLFEAHAYSRGTDTRSTPKITRPSRQDIETMSTTQALGFCGITNHNLLKIRSEPLTLPNRGSILADAATVPIRSCSTARSRSCTTACFFCFSFFCFLFLLMVYI